MTTTILKKISLTVASVVLFAGITAGTTFAQGNTNNQNNSTNQNQTQWFTDTISPMNNSGVHGFARLKLTGDQLTVYLTAWGLEANKEHQKHIHGKVDGSNAVCPPASANTDADPTISLLEGLPFYGPILQPLTPFQTPGMNGREVYQNTFTVNTSDPTMNVLPLENREIVLHGKTVAANEDLSNPSAGYDGTLPVACGHIVPIFNGFGNGSGNGNGQGQNGAGVSIEGNGAGSRNNVDIHASNTTRVTQSNESRVNNFINSHLNTGNNHANSNTDGDIVLDSGSAMNTTSIFNGGGMNIFSH